MDPIVKKPRDLASGLLFLAVGGSAIAITRDYQFGAARKMGSGYFPTMLAVVLALIGAILIARSFTGRHAPLEVRAVRPMLAIFGGVLLFGLLIRPAGLVVAILAMIVCGALGDPRSRPLPVLVSAAVLSVGCAFVFVHLLGQPMPILGSWFE